MGVLTQQDDYTNESHDAMIQQHIEELERQGYEITDVIKHYGWWPLKNNNTKIFFKKPCG